MMREGIQIKLYNEGLLSVENLVDMHRIISIENPVSKGLIYSDDNFIRYFKESVLESLDQLIFLLIDGEEVQGFCRLRKVGKNLFLNNILIKQEAQGKGFGKMLLFESIKRANEIWNLDFFQLDVFQTNDMALNWYKSLEMNEVSSVFWYKMKIKAGKNKIQKIDKIVNKSGFTDLYFDSEKIGAFVNNNIILDTIESCKYFVNQDENDVYIKSKEEIEDQNEFSLELLDVSIRLEIAMTNLKFN